jgi:hypothetical protein
MTEQVLRFGKAKSLVGILTDPPAESRAADLPAFVVLNAGLVHRVGPHRLFVHMARKLAAMGFVVLRFDHSGIGDSKVREDNLPFEQSAISETQEAMNCLSALRGSKQFVLVGLCSGTFTSFRTARSDNRVVGAVLLNALLESPETINEAAIADAFSRKTARGYWRSKIFLSQSWLKIITGKASYKHIFGVLYLRLRSPFMRRRFNNYGPKQVVADLRSLIDRGVKLFFVYSEGTSVLEYFRLTLAEEIRRIASSAELKVEIMQETDHTFTLLQHQARLLKLICGWAGSMARN